MIPKRTLLFVDDEPNILKALLRVFFDTDFHVETFVSPMDALTYMEEHEVHLIISDQRMPGMTGVKFLRKAKEIDDSAIRIILTGYADIEAAVEAINDGQIYKFIFKPWNDEDLLTTVQRALEHYELGQENQRLLSELVGKNAELEEWNKTLNQKVKERTSIIVQRNLELGKMTKVLEQSLVSTVRVMSALMEQVNPDIAAHARRVAFVATSTAGKLDFSEEQVRDVEISALLHDIGKLGIPRDIILKPEDRRTESDIKLLANHPILGQAILSDVVSFKYIGKIIRHHHENSDGSGYPDGLRGESIPVEARLISVCSVYDHLKNHAMGGSSAFLKKFFGTNSDKRFDPQMCEAILAFQAEFDLEKEPSRIASLMPHELKPGMVLAQNLRTEGGIFLLPQGQVLNDTHVTTIREMHRMDPIVEAIKVHVPKSGG